MEAFYIKITWWQCITANAASEQTCAICKKFKSPSASQQRLLKDIKTGNPGTFYSLTHPLVSTHHLYRFTGTRNKLSLFILFIVLLIYGSVLLVNTKCICAQYCVLLTCWYTPDFPLCGAARCFRCCTSPPCGQTGVLQRYWLNGGGLTALEASTAQEMMEGILPIKPKR